MTSELTAVAQNTVDAGRLAAVIAEVAGVAEAVGVTRRRLRPQAVQPVPTRSVRLPHPIESDRLPGGPLADLDGGRLDLPPGAATTLQAALRNAAQLAPDHGTRFLVEDQPDSWQSYPDLLVEAERVLAGLRAIGLRPGDPALFVFEDNRLYLTAFWACVLGGFVPTPVAVATSYDSPNEVNRKLYGAWNLLGRPVILTDPATAGPLAGVRELWRESEVRIVSVSELMGYPQDRDWYPARPESPVLNLLTSGSTGVPKCVQHTHASVSARSHAVIAHCGLTRDDVSLVWMPLDHVTVAFYNVRDTFLGATHINARTSHFLGDCLRWLDWIDRYRVTNLWAPNFAFAMVNERSADIAERRWDLSCLREMTNGGEPVIATVSHRFLRLLAPHGLRADAMVPAWGMSETCSGVTYGRQRLDDLSAGTISLDPGHLHGAVRLSQEPDAVTVSTVGRPIPGVRLRVVNEQGAVLPEDAIGELIITGDTMMRGYFANPEAQRAAYTADGWFRTGDLAFVHDGEVVIIGRTKDQIIIRGANYLAHELESVVEQVPGLRVTCTAATGVRDLDGGAEQLAIFFVPQRWDSHSLTELVSAVRAKLVREVGLAPDLLIPVTEAEFSKTSSGKIQRSALVEALQAGRFKDRVIGQQPTERADDSWLAGRRWVELTGATEPNGAADGVLLIAEPAAQAALSLAGRLAVATAGDWFAELAPDRFTVKLTDQVSVRRLLDTVTARFGSISTVVYVVPPSPSDAEPASALLHATAELAGLVGGLGNSIQRLLVATSGSVWVRPGDHLDLGGCGLPGLVRTAAAESDSTLVRQVDLPADRGEWAAALALELADPITNGVVAVRAGRRWQPKLAPVPADRASRATVPITDNGRYLITGGLGGIAEGIAGYLLAEYGARLLLVGRSELDGQRQRRLAELSQLGDVSYLPLDVADAEELAAAVAEAETRWGGTLDGVFHLASADPTGAWRDPGRHCVARAALDEYAAQYHAKVSGTIALARLLETRPSARLILFGSVNGEFGGYGFGAYAAANAFLIGFAEAWRRERGREGTCVAWSMWSRIGLSRDLPPEPAAQHGFRTIDPDHGVRLLLSALSADEPYLLAGVDLAHPAVAPQVAPEHVEITELIIAYRAEDGVDTSELDAAGKQLSGHPVPVRLVELPVIARRPDGSVDEAQVLLDVERQSRGQAAETVPATELERRIARIWSAALTRPRIGRDQTFFELGGNSLLAARLLALVDQEFGVRIPTRDLYERPTVADMAEALAGRG